MSIRIPAAFCLGACCLLAFAAFHSPVQPSRVNAASGLPSSVAYTPSYTKEGDLVPPLNYREWIYLTSGLGMNYDPKPSSVMPNFDNVFVNREAYQSFLVNGTWPDKTVMVLEGRGSASKGSINKSGHFQSGGVMGLEIHIKDEARFPGKWAFFNVESETKASLIPPAATCYSCHADHAAVDTTFVQFYPTLLPIAEKKSTLSANYLKEIASEGTK